MPPLYKLLIDLPMIYLPCQTILEDGVSYLFSLENAPKKSDKNADNKIDMPSQTSHSFLFSEPHLVHQPVERANRYLAQFAPLLEMPLPDNAIEAQKRLQVLGPLRDEANFLLIGLRNALSDEDIEIRETVRETLSHLESMHQDCRAMQCLEQDSVSIPDLREKMAERSARKEVEEITGVALPNTQNILLAPRSIAGFLGMGAFALFWNGFTLVHATFMIGGMYKAVGPAALFLLLFYALFFGAGFAMIAGALNSLATHTLTLSGNQLCITRDFGFTKKERLCSLTRECRVERLATPVKQKGSSGREIAIIASDGKEFRFGGTLSTEQQKDIIAQIKAYLRQLSR
jgi:hypothetical protein